MNKTCRQYNPVTGRRLPKNLSRRVSVNLVRKWYFGWKIILILKSLRPYNSTVRCKKRKISNTRCLMEAIIYSNNSPPPRVTSKIFILARIREGVFYYLLFCSFEIYKNQARFSKLVWTIYKIWTMVNNECLIVNNISGITFLNIKFSFKLWEKFQETIQISG